MSKIVWAVIAITIPILMLFGNRKVRLFNVLVEQLKVYWDDKKQKPSVWDYLCFIVFPIVLAITITIGFGCCIDKTLAGVLTTVFAFVFTVLFGFAALLVAKIDSENELEKQVVKETFVSVLSANVLSLVSSVSSVIIFMIDDYGVLITILSVITYSLSFMVIMLLLMISKRTFIIFENNQR